MDNMAGHEDISYLQKEYEIALARNREAKEHHSTVLNEAKHRQFVRGQGDSSRSLNTHLELLRLRKKHDHLQILSHYIDEAESIAKDTQIFEPEALPPPTEEENAESHDQTQFNSMLEEAKSLTRNLEIALLEARHQLKRDKALLAEVEDRSNKTATAPPTNSAKLRALLATRAELTQWIESTLAKCETPVPDIEGSNIPEEQPSLETVQQDIDKQYERYLTARKEALASANALTQPLSNRSDPKSPTRPGSSSPSKKRQHQRQQSFQYLRVGTDEHSSPPTLSQIESTHLPLHTHQALLNSQTKHLLAQLAQLQSSLKESLHRLSDESQLRPSYPLLENSTQFQNARSVFSRADPPPSPFEGRVLTHSDVKGNRLKAGAAEAAEISRLLDAWAFASHAAETSTSEMVAAQAKEAKASILQAEETLQDMKEKHKVWESLADMERGEH